LRLLLIKFIVIAKTSLEACLKISKHLVGYLKGPTCWQWPHTYAAPSCRSVPEEIAGKAFDELNKVKK
jgi:hypothetical protein